MKTILISGKARHGKDYTANIIKECLETNGKKVIILHFANTLKRIAKEYYNWNGEKDEEGRALLQKIGDSGRLLNINYWIESTAKEIDILSSTYDYTIIADVRYPNEITYFKEHNYDCTSIRVARTEDYLPFDNELTQEAKNHPSETSLDKFEFDYYLHNDSTLKYNKTIINTLFNQTKPKLIVDMDETINNLVHTLLIDYNEKYNDNVKMEDITDYNIDKFIKISSYEFFHELSREELFARLVPYKGVVDSLTMLNSIYDIYFVTAGESNTAPWRDRWLTKYFNFYKSDKLIMCKNKEMIKADVRIDDYPKNLEVNDKSIKILFDQPWNKKVQSKDIKRFHNWNLILIYLIDISLYIGREFKSI